MVRITGTTQLAGVIGWPIEHSLSPAMHNAVYEELGLDWAYLPMPIKEDIGVRRVVAAVRELPFVGFNVTMPYKSLMLELCDEVALAAQMAGAVNTVHCTGGRLVGYNTDGRGLIESLSEDAGFTPEGKRIAVLGAGGAAGAAFVALALARAARVDVVSRDITRAEDVIRRAAASLKSCEAAAFAFEDAHDVVSGADLVVNATPLGMRQGDPSPVPAAWLSSSQVVFDMVYGRTEPTALVRDARMASATALDGLGMLVRQGAIAVDIWNRERDEPTPRDVMRAAAERELASRGSAGEARE